MDQLDVFWLCPSGRLKLRYEEGRSELIWYLRSDEPKARPSDYYRCATQAPEQLEALLRQFLEPGPVIRKRRAVFRLRQTRVHLDDVEGLGLFTELETQVHGDREASAREEHDAVVRLLGLSTEARVAESYADLFVVAFGWPVRQ